MDRPRNISSGEAMRWNADVERRRRAYHERRCAEDPIYRRAYERQQEMMQRVQKMQSVAMTQLQNAMGEAENTKCQQVTDQVTVAEEPQRVKTHEEVMRERAMLSGQTGKQDVGFGLGFAVAAMMFADHGKMQKRMKEMEEERPYLEEINRIDAKFDNDIIRMSGFEW